jgi:predicted transposase YbfD/YdcC
MVSAWLSGAGLVLGQVKTNDKSNEINAIPELLRLLDLKDAVVTTDAMGCQRAIAEQIVEQGGHYVLAVKENQPTLYQNLVEFFADAERVQRCVDDPAPVINEHKTVDADHGRLEERTCRVSQELSWVEGRSDWRGLRTIARVESVREDLVSGKSSREYRYYISSLPHATGLGLGTIIRNHWGIENSLHWVLDVTFGEDSSRVRIGNAAENLSTIRKTALNLLKATPGTRNKKRLSLPRKRKRCSWDHDYLLDTISLVQDL